MDCLRIKLFFHERFLVALQFSASVRCCPNHGATNAASLQTWEIIEPFPQAAVSRAALIEKLLMQGVRPAANGSATRGSSYSP